MRRGIFGGTFNPPHLGHRKALEDFIELAELDKCSVFPTGTPPHKIYQREISDKHRFELVRLAFSDIAEPDDYEMKKSGKSYTVETLDYLRKIYPEDRLFLFMGSDMFLNFENVWYRYEDIINYTTVVCLSRTGEDFGLLEEHELRLRKLYSAEIMLFRTEPLRISSTQIRQMIKKGGDYSAYIDKRVKDYIIKYGLYKN